MSARDSILRRVRDAAVRSAGADADRPGAVAARLRGEGPGAPVPAFARLDPPARLQRFEERLRAVDATVSRIASAADLPRALAEELRSRNLPAAIRHGADPLFGGLDWGGIDATTGIGRLEEPATLSRAAFGIAETGTLALLSGPDNPVTLTFLGETHFAVVSEADILGGLDDLWAALRAGGQDPRTVNLVTGPSRSADIGQILQLGAHGPVALHVFLLGRRTP
jgi:L-lactate dehydrogenase complex protein LldG